MADWKETQEDLERANTAFEAEEAFRIRLQGENTSLSEINAELLAALKLVVSDDDFLAEVGRKSLPGDLRALVNAAITRAEAGK